MILLDFNSLILLETLNQRIAAKSKSHTHVVLCDFDGFQYELAADNSNKSVVLISIQWACFNELKKFGVEQRLKTIYGDLVAPTSAGYDFTLRLNTETPPANVDEVVKKISFLKRHTFASVFNAVFESLDGKGSTPDIVTIPYRRNEALYIKKTDGNRIITIFSINFQDKDDIVYSDVFLKELTDTRKQISSAPPVMFSHSEPPLEIANVQGLYKGDDQGYVSFVIAAGAAGSARREQTIDNIMLFRNYLMYHIKCSKAYLHTRMRNRTVALLQVLNRAKMKAQEEEEKKTITGRTFVRK